MSEENRMLKTWDVVRVMPVRYGRWITDVVYRTRNGMAEVDVGLDPLSAVVRLQVGEAVLFKFPGENEEVVVRGTVSAISPRFPRCATLKTDSVELYRFNRDAIRYDVNLSTLVKKDFEADNGTIGLLKNISMSGMSVETRMELELLLEGTALQDDGRVFAEAFVRPDKVLSLVGTVVRRMQTEKGMEYGIRLDHMEPVNAKRLQMFLYALEDDERANIESQRAKLSLVESKEQED